MPETIISVRDVHKAFGESDRDHNLWSLLFGSGRAAQDHPIKALEGISLEIHRGDVFGIIGRNGSGKSTLLKIIAGVLAPTSGTLSVQGRLSAILELGAGFDAEKTGRENAILFGYTNGLSSEEVARSLPEIERFAGVGEFFDKPLRTYSTGMRMRVAFAAATQIQPDILIVDEALAVGDAAFQRKCFEYLDRLKDCGVTIIFVSHAELHITTLCNRVALLDQGRLFGVGKPKEMLDQYKKVLSGDLEVEGEMVGSVDGQITETDLCCENPLYNPSEERWGDGSVEIVNFGVDGPSVKSGGSVPQGGRVMVWFDVRDRGSEQEFMATFHIRTTNGLKVFGINSRDSIGLVNLNKEKNVGYRISIELSLNLAIGDYFLSFGAVRFNGDDLQILDRRYDLAMIRVVSDRVISDGLAFLPHSVTLEMR